jgi:PAS domain S-box-containing protein
MEDGKIVISNQKAEELFGLSRQALLGENIFTFIEDGAALRTELLSDLGEGKACGGRAATRQTIKSFQGLAVAVEMSISASRTDQNPMFTAILREIS